MSNNSKATRAESPVGVRGTEKRAVMKQVGVIVYGGGLNVRAWIDAEKLAGRAVVLRDGYCEIWS